MKGSYSISIFILFFISSISLNGYSQNVTSYDNSEYENVYSFADSIYGSNDFVENGVIYHYPNKEIHGTPFLNKDNWNKSILYISGKRFNTYLIKYDLAGNKLITKVLLNKTKNVSIVLNKLFIDSFLLDNKKFINTNIFDSCSFKINYLQELHKGNLSFFRVYKKHFIEMYDDNNPFGKFSELKSDLYIYDGILFNRITKKKDLRNIFKDKEKRKKINAFLKPYKNNLTKLSSENLKSIMNYCNTIYEKN